MSFSFGNAGGGGSSQGGSGFGNAQSGGPQANQAFDLKEIQTEGLGFVALNGDSKVRLLPSQWPKDSLPPPTSSLLSVASRKGLLAAAGPDSLVLTYTETVRKAFSSGDSSEKTKAFNAELTIQIPRVSQVAFSSDEKYLVISAENGGGLAVYEVDALLNNNKKSAFELSTQNIAVRALLPNPSVELGHMFSLVLTNGNLLLADLAAKQLIAGPSGPVLKENVSCVSWSAKGKQLVAGMGDGTAQQLKPDGQLVSTVPKAPNLEGNQHVSSVFWLANDDFLLVYTPTSYDTEAPPDSTWYLAHRTKGSEIYAFHKFADNPSPPYGMNRSPPHHFIQRLRDFPPHLSDMLIVASTASADVGMITKTTSQLSSDSSVTDQYTNTSVAKDEYRASLPFSDEEMSDTSPIGLVLDLSSKDKIKRPIKAEEEFEESPTPLPALMILNHEGILSSWWVLYHESIRAKQGFPGLVTLQGQVTPQLSQGTQQQSSPFKTPGASATQASGFSAFSKPAQPAFGSPALQGGSFGGAAALGQRSSPWGSPAAAATTVQGAGSSFGKPAFGSTGMMGAGSGSGFGSVGGLGNKASPWGAASSGSQQTGAQSGQSAFGGSAAASSSPFSKFSSSNQATASPFSSFGGGSGFGSLGKPGQSAFAGAGTTPGTSFGLKTEPSFGSTVTIESGTLGSSDTGSKFPSWAASSSTFNTSGQAQSTFGQQSSFASVSRESDMDDADDAINRERSEATPTPQDKPSTAGAKTEGFKLGSTFKGDDSAKDDVKETNGTSMFGAAFGNALTSTKAADASSTPKEPEKEKSEQKLPTLFGSTSSGAAQPPSNNAFGAPKQQPTEPKAEAAPLPPDFTKPSETKTEQKQEIPSAPLPPDFTKLPTKEKEEEAPPPAPLPPDFTKVSKSVEDKELPPLAGSPPIKVEAPESPISSPADDAGDSSKKTEAFPRLEEEDDEGLDDDDDDLEDEADEDDFKREDDTGHSIITNIQPSQTPQWSLGQTPRPQQFLPPAPSPPTITSVPGGQKAHVPSATPFGYPKAQHHFPPPTSRLHETPRSPSPVRSASTPLGIRRQAVPPAQPVSRPVSRPAPPVEAELTAADLSDDEDEQIRAELAAPILASKKLEPFLAHQDYVGRVSKTGIAGQIEKVYRDINSMVDTLGLNARTLASFIRGQTELLPEHGRSRDDLDEVIYKDTTGDWCLVEIEDLQMLEGELEESLISGRLTDVPALLADMNGIQTECSRLRSRVSALRREFNAERGDIDALARNAPLSAEQISQQKTLRAGFANLQKNLREAEDAAVLLRTKLSSIQASSGNGSRPNSTPTVEAVTNTILKMTRMIEQKSGDIDLLESQMRRMRATSREPLSASLATLSIDGGDEESVAQVTPKRVPGAWAPDDSPFVTPPSSRRRFGKTFGYYTPESKPETPSPAINGGSSSSNTRKIGRSDGLDEETVGLYVQRARRQREVRERLEAMLAEKGTRVTRASGEAAS